MKDLMGKYHIWDADDIRNNYPIMKDSIICGHKSTLGWIESMDPELQCETRYALEAGLTERKQVMTESVFMEEYDRALSLYRKICNDNGYAAEI